MLLCDMKSRKSVITGLTANEEAFAELLAKGYDSYTAHCTVFGVGTAKRKSKVEMATRLAKKDNITSYLERLREETRARGVIDRDWILQKLTLLADFGTGKQSKYDKDGNLLESFIDSNAANSALDKMIKMGGFYAAEKIETETRVKGKFVLNLRTRTDID